jgi:hypothetical protein
MENLMAVDIKIDVVAMDKNCPGAKSVVETLPHRGAATAIRAKSEEQGDDKMVSYLLKLLDGTLVNSTALVDQVACIVL